MDFFALLSGIYGSWLTVKHFLGGGECFFLGVQIASAAASAAARLEAVREALKYTQSLVHNIPD